MFYMEIQQMLLIRSSQIYLDWGFFQEQKLIPEPDPFVTTEMMINASEDLRPDG